MNSTPATGLGSSILLVIVASFLPLLLGELAVRVLHGKLLSLDSARKTSSQELFAGPRAVYDSYLGYVPKPGRRVGEFTATIGANNLRSNGESGVQAKPYILAVGDSYTFGDGVNDHETWPAFLQAHMGQTVLNGGVFGYGLDQTVLRAQSLIDTYQPQIVIISMIADDVRRSELSYRYAWKPYFDIVEGQLELRNVPVPKLPPPSHANLLRDALSYSYLAHSLLRRLAPTWWHPLGSEQRVHDQGEEVAALLMEHLAAAVQDCGTRVLVVAQLDRSLDSESLKPILHEASNAGLETLDLMSPLSDLIRADPKLQDRMFLGPYDGHMKPAGNKWVAEKIAERLLKMRDNEHANQSQTCLPDT